MLKCLDFNLVAVPTPYHFLARYLKAAGADKEVSVCLRSGWKWVLELSCVFYCGVTIEPCKGWAGGEASPSKAKGEPSTDAGPTVGLGEHATQCELLATFLTELALPEYSFLKYSSSLLSCAAVYTANKTLGRTAMPPALAYHSQYTEAQIRPCAQQLVQLHRKASSASLLAVHKKYSTTKFMEVAKRAPALSLLDGAAN